MKKVHARIAEAIADSKLKLKSEVIISHHMKLADTEVGYKIFDKKVNERRKVVLTP